MLTLQIFWVFFRIGWLSFGGVFGVLPELERMVVHEHGWIGTDQFVRAYVVGQFLPGPNMAMCSIIGYWVGGWAGLAAAYVGIYLPPLACMAGAYLAFRRGRELSVVRRGERAVRPVLLGLFAAAALRLWWGQLAPAPELDKFGSAILVALAVWANVWLGWGPLLTILASGTLWYGLGVLA